MKRFLLALLLWPALASAQSPVAPWPGVSVPIFGISSEVAGDGTFTPQLFGPQSCTVPAYSYTGATTNGWGASGGTTLCPVISGASVATFTTSAFTLGTGLKNGWVDAFLSYESAAVIQQGADAAGVTDQIFKGPDRITSDGVGGNLTLAGGRNRGASAGGSIIFQTSPAAGAGVTGTLATVGTFDSTGQLTVSRSIGTGGAAPTTIGRIEAGEGMLVASTGFFNFTSRGGITASADAKFVLANNAANAGFGLDFTTDGLGIVRQRAQGTTIGLWRASFQTAGTTPSVANVGANSCGTSAATIAGNDNNGIITVGATAGTQCRITFVTAAPTRRECVANNETTANLLRTTYVSTTQTDVLGTMVAGDVLSYVCFSR